MLLSRLLLAAAIKVRFAVIIAITWIGELLEALGAGFSSFGSQVLTFIKTGFMDLFLIYTESQGVITISGPSAFAIFTFFTCGVALVISLTHWITNLCRRKI